jgi:hypothetical protein
VEEVYEEKSPEINEETLPESTTEKEEEKSE